MKSLLDNWNDDNTALALTEYQNGDLDFYEFVDYGIMFMRSVLSECGHTPLTIEREILKRDRGSV